MLERRRVSKGYTSVSGDDVDEEQDVELGEGIGREEQETGVIHAEEPTKPTVTEQLDNWDENAEEWDDDEGMETEGANGLASPTEGGKGSKKRAE